MHRNNMTNGQAQQPHYQTFLAGMDEVREVGQSLAESRGTVEDIQKKGKSNVRAYAFALLKKVLGNRLNPAITADTLDLDLAMRVAQEGSSIALQRAGTTMYQHLESIVDSEMPEPTLEKLVLSKELNPHIAAEDQNMVGRYAQYRTLDDMVKHYEATKSVRNEEEAKRLNDAVLRGIKESIEKDFAGDPEYVREGFTAIAITAYRKGAVIGEGIQEYALPGLKAQVEDAKKAYGALVQQKGRTIADVARTALKETKKLPLQQFERIYQTIYKAETGKELAPVVAE